MSRYVVKSGELYANGLRGWVAKRCDAFVFEGATPAGTRQRAKEHADSFRYDGTATDARAVRLVPKKAAP